MGEEKKNKHEGWLQLAAHAFTLSVLFASTIPERHKASPPLSGHATSQVPRCAAFVVAYRGRQWEGEVSTEIDEKIRAIK